MYYINSPRTEFRYYLGDYVVHLPACLPFFNVDDDLCPPLHEYISEYLEKSEVDVDMIPSLIISYNNLRWYPCPADEEPCFDRYDDDMQCRDSYIDSLIEDASIDDIFTLSYDEARVILSKHTNLIPHFIDVLDTPDAAYIFGDAIFEMLLNTLWVTP